MSLLKISALNLWYGSNHVLKDVNFSLNPGEVLCVVGESGSGKSSILYSILGLLPESARLRGSITFKGEELVGVETSLLMDIRGRHVGMIFQEPSSYLDPLFTVGSQIEETFTGHYPDRKAEAREFTLRAMRRAGIPKAEEKYNMYPHQLSGGLKQRVCIAMAVVCEPEIILADEPTTALDVSVQKRILTLFRRLKEEGKSIILVTHDFGVVAEVGDRVLVLKDGVVVEEGGVFDVFDRPEHDYTKTLLRAI